jgi:hypothetical protein
VSFSGDGAAAGQRWVRARRAGGGSAVGMAVFRPDQPELIVVEPAGAGSLCEAGNGARDPAPPSRLAPVTASSVAQESDEIRGSEGVRV